VIFKRGNFGGMSYFDGIINKTVPLLLIVVAKENFSEFGKSTSIYQNI